MERGDSTPQPYYRDKLCEVFGMSLKDLGYDFLARSDHRTRGTTSWQ